MSLALEVGRLVESHLTGRSGRLTRVGLVVGSESGTEPANLAFCLGAVLAYPPFNGPETVMRCEPGDALRLEFIEVDDGN
jgi:hypothetical protein